MPEYEEREKYANSKEVLVNSVKLRSAFTSLCDMFTVREIKFILSDLVLTTRHSRFIQIPDKGKHLEASPRALRDISRDDFFATPETQTSGSIFLTDTGRKQLTQGLRRCTAIDTPFFGDDRLRPVTRYEKKNKTQIILAYSCGLLFTTLFFFCLVMK